MLTGPLVRLPVRYPHRGAVLANSRAEGSHLTLFVPGWANLAIGADVVLEITFGDSELRFELEGRVSFQRKLPAGPRQQAGLGFIFVGHQKRPAAQMIAQCAGRAIDDGTALGTRHAVTVSCLVKFNGSSVAAEVKDLSSTGAFVGAPKLRGLREDEELTLHLEPIFGRWGGQLLKARVIWVGEKKGIGGFGVRFVDDSQHVRSSLKKHLPL